MPLVYDNPPSSDSPRVEGLRLADTCVDIAAQLLPPSWVEEDGIKLSLAPLHVSTRQEILILATLAVALYKRWDEPQRTSRISGVGR
jgi:hypothetical protein